MATLPPRAKITQGPSRHVYDVILFGGQLGAAFAGALLAKRGYRVLYVEHDGTGAGYSHQGYLLPYAPFIAPPLKTMPVVEEALTELGLNTTVTRTIRPHSPELQLIFERERVDLHLDGPRRSAELIRAFGEEAREVEAALNEAPSWHDKADFFFREQPELPPQGFMEEWRLRKLAKRFPGLQQPSPFVGQTPGLRLLSALRPFVSYLTETTTPLAQARALTQALTLPGRYPGGREALREVFLKKLADLGGNVLVTEGGPPIVEELEMDGSRLVGLKVVRSEVSYRGAAFVAGTDAPALRRLIPDKKKQRDLSVMLDGIDAKQFLFSVNWVLELGGVPPGMGELLLLDAASGAPDATAAHADAQGPMLLQLTVARRADGGHEIPSQRVLTAGLFLPMSARELGEPHLQQVAQQVERRLEALLPFSRDHLALSSSPYLDAAHVRGSRLLPHALYSIDPGSALGISGLGQRTPVKNLLLASREVLPGLGFEGELLAGLRAARMVGELLSKKDPLKA